MNRVYVMQLVRSFQCGELSRRDFLKQATLALGSVSAANLLLTGCMSSPAKNPPPVVEEKPKEKEETAPEVPAGLVTENVEYKGPDENMLMGYLAHPEGEGPFPAVVVIQEWWGLNEHIKDVARRFAQEGFATLAPDLYHGVVTTEPDEARKLVMELDMPKAVQEIQHAVTFLLEQGYVTGPKAGIVGFCMGGGLVLQTALVEENIGGCVAFYGRPLSAEDAGNVKAPIMGLYGSEDQGIPVSDIEIMQATFEAAGIEHDIHVYEGAQHAFFNDTRASSYNEEASADAWQRTLGWFKQYL